eukprot:SAG22_NODE_133_length_18379_cov_34.571937_6_plen_205_part_00
MPHTTDDEHPDGRIATWAVETLTDFARRGAGVKGADRPFFLGVGLHKPHLPHIVPQKYFDLYPDVAKISLPPNMEVPLHFPQDAWSPSGELRSYIDMGAAFAEANFSMQTHVDLLDIRHVRRGYFAATSFADANLGRVMNALTAAGPTISQNTVTVLWSDHVIARLSAHYQLLSTTFCMIESERHCVLLFIRAGISATATHGAK